MNKLEISWQEKSLHGKFATRCKNDDVDTKATHQWLTSSGLKAETEGFIFAAANKSHVTKNFQTNIIRNGTDPKCRFCGEKVETIDQLIFECSVLTPGEYKRRHDRVGQYLHWRIFKHFKVSTKKTGMNIIQRQLLMVQISPFFGTSQSRLTEQNKPTDQTLS